MAGYVKFESLVNSSSGKTQTAAEFCSIRFESLVNSSSGKTIFNAISVTI